MIGGGCRCQIRCLWRSRSFLCCGSVSSKCNFPKQQKAGVRFSLRWKNTPTPPERRAAPCLKKGVRFDFQYLSLLRSAEAFQDPSGDPSNIPILPNAPIVSIVLIISIIPNFSIVLNVSIVLYFPALPLFLLFSSFLMFPTFPTFPLLPMSLLYPLFPIFHRSQHSPRSQSLGQRLAKCTRSRTCGDHRREPRLPSAPVWDPGKPGIFQSRPRFTTGFPGNHMRCFT